MEVIIEPFGTLFNKSVFTFSIQVPGGISVEFTNIGAAISRVVIPAKSTSPSTGGFEASEAERQICLGFDSAEEYRDNPPFFGVTVGPVANRISLAKFSLHGKTYELEANDGEHCLHSGPDCTLAYKVFDSQVYESDDVAGVVFTYGRPDGEGGFPGNAEFQAAYWVTGSNEIIIDYRATTDGETPINLTNHSYWNLNGEGKGLVYDHQMQILSDSYLPVDDTFIPTGEIRPVSRDQGIMDFRQPKLIGKDIDETDSGYDHCYILNPAAPLWQSPEPSQTLLPEFQEVLDRCAQVRHAATAQVSGLSMEVYTNQPAVQFYSGNMLKGVIGRKGLAHTPRTAFCLETAGYNNACNQPQFPSWNVKPGQVYTKTTVHRFLW